ncbi:MAG: hypothetical protein P1P88_07415 [Bacteroidales bacterium]|nr:hypothetical protein [Bacteroidales bacterium]
MANKHLIKSVLAGILSLSFIIVSAQDFSWQTKLPAIENEGFYKILLSPEISAKLQNNFGDIRIYDADNKEVPYIFESEKPLSYSDYFVEYKIIEKKEQTAWPYYTRLVIHNPEKTKISNIHLIIRNSDVSKSLKLSGSDDNKNWYIIRDGYRFQAMYSDETTSVIKIIDFPVSNYEYYEILIDDWKNNPLNIQKAGYYNTSVDQGKYSVIASPQINQLEKKEEKQTLVKVVYPEKYSFDKITVHVQGPEFYYRTAEIQIRDSVKNKRNEYDYYFSTIANITLSSSSQNTWYFNNLRTNVLYLRIDNKDDEPLNITGVEGEQLNHYLICKLKKSEAYTLRFGNAEISSPNYDLQYFKDKIPEAIKILQTSDIASLKSEVQVEDAGFKLDSAFIWVAIIAVVILLIYMVTKMMKDMKSDPKS